MSQNPQETPEQKLTRLQLEKLEREEVERKGGQTIARGLCALLVFGPLIGGILIWLFIRLIGLG